MRSGQASAENNVNLHYKCTLRTERYHHEHISRHLAGPGDISKRGLQHLGIKPGERIELDLLPNGRAELKAAQPRGSFGELRGILKNKTNAAHLSIEESTTR